MFNIRSVIAAVSILVSVCLAAQPQQPPIDVQYSPFNAVQIANDDIISVAALNDQTLNTALIRYLSLHNHGVQQKPEVKAITDFVLNSLNPKSRKIVRTATLPTNSSTPIVLRVNLADYNISPKAWDDLAEKGSGPIPLPDPYFHTFLSAIKTQQATAKATIGVKYVNGATATSSEVHVIIPGAVDVFFNDKQAQSKTAGTLKKYTLAQMTPGQEAPYNLRLVGTHNDIPFDLSTRIVCRCNQIVEVQVSVPLAQPGTLADKSKVLAAAPWLALEPNPALRGSTIASLIQLTGCKNPILRADWFVTYATLAPAYYQLIGLQQHDNPDKEAAKKKPKVVLERDFEKLMNADLKSASPDLVAGITDTRIVALHNRILHRYNTVTGVTGGYYWRSKDTDTGIDDQDYLNQVASFDNPKFIATEIIASGRNGLNFYFVGDNKGTGLDLAAAAVAQHSEAMPCLYQDKQVWSARNCMLCHAEGMINVRDKVRTIARDKIALFIADKTKDHELARKIDEAFSVDPQGIIATDNAKFIASVLAATDRGGRPIAKAQEKLIWNYWDNSVTLERMARESGIRSDVLRDMLAEGINLDYSLVAVLQNPEEPVALLAWERQGFAALMQYILGYQPKRK